MQEFALEDAPIIERGEGVYLWDIDGNKYLDGVSSLWCNVHGHRHPTIDQAVRDQLDKIAHTTLLGLGSVPSIELAAKLSELTRQPHVFYADCGASAVEIAMKMAFQFCRQNQDSNGNGKRTKFMALRDSYHGDTIGSVSVGGIELFQNLFRPLLFDTVFTPTPHPYRWQGEDCLNESLLEMRRILESQGDEIAALVIEPRVQGAAGMIMHPEGYLREVRRLTKEHGVLMIADEVATGFGRTGKMFAVEQEDVLPDALVLGKGITGGYLPLSAVMFSDELYQGFLGENSDMRQFFHGHTYTGNALASAAALASLQVFEEEGTLGKIEAKAQKVFDVLSVLLDHDHVGEIRQLGLMVGIEIVENTSTRKSFDNAGEMGREVTRAARKRGLIIRPLGDVIVFMPPLSATMDEIDEMSSIIVESITEVIS